MKPINAEETVRVFNGWLEEADSLAEREAIERCIDHIQNAPAVSQQELRSYMLPWFSPFAAPWCGKIQRAFPKAYVTMNFELILVPRTNTYINLNHCSTPDEFNRTSSRRRSSRVYRGLRSRRSQSRCARSISTASTSCSTPNSRRRTWSTSTPTSATASTTSCA